MNVARVITGLQIVLIGLTALLCVRAVMLFVAPQSAWTPLPTASLEQSAPNVPSARGVVGTIDTSFDPFYRSAAITASLPNNLGEDAPETSLDLTLKGRISGKKGTATLRKPDGQQESFQVGDEILPGVTLEAVNAEYIVISQEGRLERLTFEKGEAEGLRQIETPDATPPSPVQNNYTSNPLLNSINFTPERVNDQITGYKISPKQAGLETGLLGLQDGDIITSIGRVGLQDEDIDLGAVLNSLQNRRSTTVELIRNGQTISVKVGNP